jgi:hypothetical protein
MTTHSILSPSASERWLVCADSVRANTGTSDQPNAYADEGTTAHALLELCMRMSSDPLEFIGVDVAKLGFPVTEEMAGAVQHAIDYILQWQAANKKGEVLLEERIHWGKYLNLVEDVSSGTSDAVLLSRYSAVIMDYKHGAGVVVSPERNTQLMLYALGVCARETALATFTLCIVQPRARHIEGPVREWRIERKDLQEWARRTVAPAARLVLDGDRSRKAGEHCRWCAAQATCRALKELVMETAHMDFEDAGDVNELTPAELGEVLKVLPVIEAWTKAVHARALSMLLDDAGAIEGWKLVHGRQPPRQWTNEDEVLEMCKKAKLSIDAYAPRELRSPTQLEGLIPFKGKAGKADFRALFGAYITRKAAPPHIAKASDPREPYKPEGDFDAVA